MNRRDFIKIGLSTAALPAAVGIENLLLFPGVAEVAPVVTPVAISFEEWQRQLIKQICITYQIPERLLNVDYGSARQRSFGGGSDHD